MRARRSRVDNSVMLAPWTDRVAFEEAIRVLRSNINVALADLEPPTVIVTSASATEGKTLITSHLAVSWAQSGQRVVLVDFDLRHSDLHRRIGAHNECGVTDVLLGNAKLDECLQFVALAGPAGQSNCGLYFLSTGASVANPAELLGSGRTSRLLDTLAGQADLILIDTPPVLPVADTLVIGRMVSGAILVAEARRTAIPAVQKAKDLLIRNQTRMLGVVVNKFQGRDAEVGFGYGYGYGYPGANGPASPAADTAGANGAAVSASDSSGYG